MHYCRQLLVIVLFFVSVKSVTAQSEVSLIGGISPKDFIFGISYRQYEMIDSQKIFFVYEERSHTDNNFPTYFGFRAGYTILPRFNISIGASYSLISLDNISRNLIVPTCSIDYYLFPSLSIEAGFIQYPQIAIKYNVLLD
jgi:hypothetical protein